MSRGLHHSTVLQWVGADRLLSSVKMLLSSLLPVANTHGAGIPAAGPVDVSATISIAALQFLPHAHLLKAQGSRTAGRSWGLCATHLGRILRKIFSWQKTGIRAHQTEQELSSGLQCLKRELSNRKPGWVRFVSR